MSGYVKKIAVIKQLKGGFSADGGNISGLVKAETYAGFLKVEASLINLAPLSEGKYLLGISDGLKSIIFEGGVYEGESDFSLTYGFAFLLCYCNAAVSPVASAACGQLACALPDLKEEMCKWKPQKIRREGGAAAEVSYEEGGAIEGGYAVRTDKEEKKDPPVCGENEKALRPVLREEARGGLAGGDYYSRMKGDIEGIFARYPAERELEARLEGSRFVKVAYGEGRYYAFGVLSVEGVPRYICYGVPARGGTPPVTSSSYLPTPGGGYYMTFQDAATGVTVKLDFC